MNLFYNLEEDSISGTEAQALIDSSTASMQGANLIENEYAPMVPQYADFFFLSPDFTVFMFSQELYLI